MLFNGESYVFREICMFFSVELDSGYCFDGGWLLFVFFLVSGFFFYDFELSCGNF